MRKIVCEIIVCLILVMTLKSVISVSEAPKHHTGTISTDELVQLMNNKSWTTCRFIAELLVERGTEAIPPLLELFQYGDRIAQEGAITAIADIKDQRAIPVLIELLSSERRLIAGRASRVLREFGKDAVEPLLNVLREKRGNARRLAVIALGDIDDTQAVQTLQEIFSDRDDPNWKEAAKVLAKREDEIGYSVIRLANEDEELLNVVSGVLSHKTDKRLLPLFFKHKNLRGIAKTAGRAELPRIFEEGLDKTWILPFVEINAAIEGVKPEQAKADILWSFVIVIPYDIPAGDGITEMRNNFYVLGDNNPIRYAIEKLASLGDVALPIIEYGMKADNKDVKLRAIATLGQTPPSEASTELLLKALDIAGEVYMLGSVAEELGNRREKRAVPKLVEMLQEVNDDFWKAVEALDKIGDSSVLPEIVKVWEESDTTKKKNNAIAGYFAEVINHWEIADPSLIPLLVDATSSSMHGDGSFGALYEHKLAAFLSLVRIGKPSIEALREISESKDRITSELAKTALKVLQAEIPPEKKYIQEQQDKLPDQVKVILNSKYPDWRFPDVSEELLEYFKVSKLDFYPNLVWGDLNNDGQEDYVVQIVYGGQKSAVIAFLRKDGYFKNYILTTGTAFSPSLVYLHLFKKGEKDYDYETEKEFQYPSDSIGVLYFGKAGVSYIFEDGKFRKVISSD